MTKTGTFSAIKFQIDDPLELAKRCRRRYNQHVDCKFVRSFQVFSLVVSLFASSVGTALAADKPADLPNFHTVAPGIYRGAAPTEAGLRQLKSMGVKTIIDLRISPRLVKVEKDEATQLGFNWINLPMGSDPPTKKEVSIFLSTLQQAPSQPVFVHCQHGADRTGCMIGIWRETRQGWAFAPTFAEMQRYGFNKRWVKLTAAVQQSSKG